jgi:alkanesulfonate monooxygenase SsuD/methylene tetrahydromethanopterin reductase-like flavin-dependent oxidoreductase (luciferase family)
VRYGVTFDGRAPVAETLALAQAADAHGLECAWVGEHLGHRDALVYAAALLERTRRIAVGVGALSPHYRHPAQIAMGVATLRETYGPRVRLMLGLGNADQIGRLGGRTEAPARSVREAVMIVRALLERGCADVRGATFRAADVRMGGGAPAPVPIYVAAVRDGMLRVAGELGDGVSLGAAASPRYVAHAVARARAAAAAAGRDPAKLDVTCNIVTALARSRGDALTRVKRQVALILANGNDHLFTFQPHPLDRARVREALEAGPDAIDRVIPDDTADALAVAATPHDLRPRLAAFERAGVDLALLRVVGAPADQLAIIHALSPEGAAE